LSSQSTIASSSLVSSSSLDSSPSPVLVLDEEDDDEDEDEDEGEGASEGEGEGTINPMEPMPTIQDKRPPLDRPVQVDALLDKWRTQIRNSGIEAEELFLDAINEIFNIEKDKEDTITKNMALEFQDTVDSEIASLENTIINLAKKGKASDQDDPRLKELNKKAVASGKKIRNHAVEIR
jgi:hypothetical protein